MPQPITEAQPPLQFIPPQYTPWVLRLGRMLIPNWLRWQQNISHVDLVNGEALADLFEQFQAGKLRFMLAFRHPSTNDPPCIAQALWHELPQLARHKGKSFRVPPHVHFVYDRGIPLWAGSVVGWIISHLGGTPIRRGRLDTAGLRSIRDLFARGDFPVAAAPEGGTNGHNEIVSPLEPGIAQFGFWCIDDLQKSDRTEEVFIVPLGVQYRFHVAPWATLETLLTQLEQDSGIQHPPAMAIADLTNGVPLTAEQESILYQRLHYLAEHLLTVMETFYRNYYQQPVEITPSVKPGEEDRVPGANWEEKHAIAPRLQVLLNAALTVAEQSFGIKAKGTLTDRGRRLEQASWDRIYREDLKDLESLSAVERGLANLVAEDANLRIWHMHLVETFVSVTGKYVADNPTVERFADTLLLLWKMITQIKGQAKGEVSQIPKLGQQYAQLTVGQPISVSDRWADYKISRRRAVASLTDTLQQAMESLIQ
ncbi:MAG: 1-acyl-sn-glycerol-3-phosphate acyltransferase [Leptolyngbyaceae cyanobacterium]